MPVITVFLELKGVPRQVISNTNALAPKGKPLVKVRAGPGEQVSKHPA
jgi:hypothetical protein